MEHTNRVDECHIGKGHSFLGLIDRFRKRAIQEKAQFFSHAGNSFFLLHMYIALPPFPRDNLV
jgi:hypothetical protein